MPVILLRWERCEAQRWARWPARVVTAEIDGFLPHLYSGAAMAKPRRGDTVELTIDDLAFGGEGVGRLGGYVMFVSGGHPRATDSRSGSSRRAAVTGVG